MVLKKSNFILDMIEKEINGKKYKIKEIKYMDAVEVEMLKRTDIKEAARKFLSLATELTCDEINNLSMRDGLALQLEANKVNELDFQDPAKN